MQSHEDPPPPYPGTESNVVTSKGAYKGVPVYEIGSNNPPVCKFFLFRLISFNITYDKTNFKMIHQRINQHELC